MQLLFDIPCFNRKMFHPFVSFVLFVRLRSHIDQDRILADDMDLLPGNHNICFPSKEQPAEFPVDHDGFQLGILCVDLDIPHIAQPCSVFHADHIFVAKFLNAADHKPPSFSYISMIRKESSCKKQGAKPCFYVALFVFVEDAQEVESVCSGFFCSSFWSCFYRSFYFWYFCY